MIRPSARLAGAAVLAVLFIPMSKATAQTQVPSAPTQVPAAPATTPSLQAPAAPAPTAAPVFPKPDPTNFTATSPTKQEIDDFLQASWGYDENRMWQVQAILKTPADGVSRVVVLVGDKTGKGRISAIQFYALPDGKHIIVGNDIIPFGEHPFAADRAILQQRADGPYRGAASKDLELVEFADFECPHCKDAQANMDKLVADFPKARIVFQNYPLTRIHPEAKLAAEYGVCVTKMGGSSAFFQFAPAVFEGQDGLATKDGATLTLNSAVTKAGLDPLKVQACASTPAVSQEVDSSVQLARDLNIQETPTLMINGRQIPLGNIPYDMLKKIIQYQAKLDGVAE